MMIMKKSLFLPAVLSVVSFLSVSCQKGESVPPENRDAPLREETGVVRSYWKKIDIPNSVGNIRRLCEERYGATAAATGTPAPFGAPSPVPDIEPTHYYVRFEPDTDEEYYALKGDGNLDVYSHPLDCEIPEGSVSYIDPEQPLDKPQFLFGIMPVGYTPGNVRYTVLDEIVRDPDGGSLDDLVDMLSGVRFGDYTGSTGIDMGVGTPIGVGDNGNGGSSGTGTGHLQGGANAESIANHDKNRPPQEDTRLRGRIRVWDDEVGDYIPLSGVKVKVYDLWEGGATATTNALGVFVIEKRYKGDVSWSIQWEGDRYDIRDGDLPQAEYNRGGKTRQNWFLDIGSANDPYKSMRFATIYRAAQRYFHGDIGGLQRANNLGYILIHSKVKISYHDYGGTGWYNGEGLGVIPHIRIYKYQVGFSNNTTDKIFSVTCHELGHIIHYNNMGQIQFWQVALYIKESWAEFVQWYLTMLEYRALGLPQANLDFLDEWLNYQWWPYEDRISLNIDSKPEYTSIFIDLVDDFDQSINSDINHTYPADWVTGYTASKLNEILMDSYGWASLKSNLKSNKPAGVTNALIDHLFKRYENICK